MKIITHCPHCRKPTRIDDDAAGRAMRCPYCSEEFTASAQAAGAAVRADRPPEPLPDRRLDRDYKPIERRPPPKKSSAVWIVFLVLGLVFVAIVGFLVVVGGIGYMSFRQQRAARDAQARAMMVEAEHRRAMDRARTILDDAERDAMFKRANPVEEIDWGRLDKAMESPVDAPKLRLGLAKEFGSFHAATFLPDGKSVLILFMNGLLTHFSLPEFQRLRDFQLPNEGYLAVLDERLRLYVASSQKTFDGSYPKQRIAAGDLDIYDLKDRLSVDAPKSVSLKPTKTIPIGGVIQDMQLHADDEQLFLLDTTAKQMRRLSTSQQALMEPLRGIPEFCFAFCLTRDGKTLYAANDDRGSVVRFDVQRSERTGEFDAWETGLDVQLTDVQATNDGVVMVNGRRERESLVHVIDTKTKKSNVLVRHRDVSSIRLTRDSRHLITSEFKTSPAHFHALPVPKPGERTTRYLPAGECSVKANFSARGKMYVSSDGLWLLCDAGRLLQVGD